MNTLEKIIEKLEIRIMEHQRKNGFNTIFDFIHEDLNDLKEVIEKNKSLENIQTAFMQKYDLDYERIEQIEHKGKDVVFLTCEWFKNI
jgi:hypothetical protein